MTIRRTLAAIVLIAALAAACSAPAPSERPGEAANEVRAYLAAGPSSLAFVVGTDTAAEELALQITDSLVQYDPAADMRLVPRVAESWSFSDDRLTLTFLLRDGVRWHDGAPVTADDVVFSVERVRDPLAENRTWAPLLRDLVEVTAPTPDTVVARYATATPDALEAWRIPLLPRHLADDGDPTLAAFARAPVGCGPFRFVSYEPDRRIVLERNDDYWDGAPAIERLVYKIFADQRTAYQAVLTGDLDIMPITANLLEEALDSERMDGLRTFDYLRLNTTFVAWNLTAATPFDDVRVRRALVHALDRDAFIETVVNGHALSAATTYTPGTFWNTGDGPAPLAFDPGEAARLLAEAGWDDADGDGVRERDGVPFRFTLLTHRSSQGLVERLAVWQQESWRAVGVEAAVETLEFQAYRERRFAGQFEAAGGSLTFTPNPDQYELYHSSAGGAAGYNFFGYADPEADRLLEEGRTTFDQDERRAVYLELQHRLAETQALGYLFHFRTPVLVDARLEGVTASPLGYSRTVRGPRLWRWPAE